MDKETADKMRGMVRRATLRNIRDDGQTQRTSVEIAEGIWRDDVEILQSYGVATHAPEDGALALVVAVGADEGDLVVLPVSNPSRRLGGLKSGEVGIYNEHGDKAVIGAGGDINITSAASVNVTVGGVTFRVSADGVEITGGRVTHNGKDIGDTHKHTGVTPGGGLTGVPA